MIELHSRLEQIAGPVTKPSASQVEADLARGRHALRRRRAGQTAVGSAFAVIALAGAIALANAGSPGTQVAAPPPDPEVVTSPVTTPRLVAYTGEQPKGYTLDKVPDGWEVQGVDAYSLTLAPKGMANRDPDHFVGKIGVMLESESDIPSNPIGTPVQVGDKPGVLVDYDNPGGRPTVSGTVSPGGDAKSLPFTDSVTLFVKLPTGVYLQVQVWEGLGFSQNDIVELAVGIHVHPNAKRGQG